MSKQECQALEVRDSSRGGGEEFRTVYQRMRHDRGTIPILK